MVNKNTLNDLDKQHDSNRALENIAKSLYEIHSEINKSNLQLVLLQKDVDLHKNSINRIEDNLIALKDLSTKLLNMVKNHETIIHNNELQTENRRVKCESEMKEIHSRITTVAKDIKEDVEKKISVNIIGDQTLSDRVQKLETWKWLLVGGGIATGFLLTKLPNLIGALIKLQTP